MFLTNSPRKFRDISSQNFVLGHKAKGFSYLITGKKGVKNLCIISSNYSKTDIYWLHYYPLFSKTMIIIMIVIIIIAVLFITRSTIRILLSSFYLSFFSIFGMIY